jgi:thymidylate synthase (FAD)
MKNKYFPVLDYGFVALKDSMGSDEDIEQAARISYGKGTRKKSDTRNLIRYLMRHKHTSPFEMCELKFHVRVPMDCWRQWIRHRTASVNEYSSRYSEVPFLCQKTPANLWRLQNVVNKQGSSGYLVEENGGEFCGKVLTEEETYLQKLSYICYDHRLKAGVAREQARKDLPLSIYTEAFWKIDLHNLLHFLNLRCQTNAQEEIRKYANVIAGIVKKLYPITFEAWYDYTFTAKTFTQTEFYLMRIYREQIYEGFEAEARSVGLSSREIDELVEKLTTVNYQDFTINIDSAKDYADFNKKEEV